MEKKYKYPHIFAMNAARLINHKSHWLQVKIWFQNRRMKWKRSKKAHQEAKHGNSRGESSSSTKDSRSATSRSRSPHNHQSSEDEKSVKQSSNEKGYSNSGDVLGPPPTMAVHPAAPPTRLYSAMDFSSPVDISKQQQQDHLNDNNGVAVLMKRPPLFFPEDANGEMFRPYVS